MLEIKCLLGISRLQGAILSGFFFASFPFFLNLHTSGLDVLFCWGKEEEEKDEVSASFLCCSVWPMSRKTSSSSSSSLAFGLAAIKISLAFFLLLSSGEEEKDVSLQHEKSLSINPKEREERIVFVYPGSERTQQHAF